MTQDDRDEPVREPKAHYTVLSGVAGNRLFKAMVFGSPVLRRLGPSHSIGHLPISIPPPKESRSKTLNIDLQVPLGRKSRTESCSEAEPGPRRPSI